MEKPGKPYDPYVSFNPPKSKVPLNLPSLHPFMWMAAEFIRKVPLDEINDENIREKWQDYQQCAIQAIEFLLEYASKIFMPYLELDERVQCMNQRIQIVIDKPIDWSIKE